MSIDDEILYQVNDRIATITLNRPERINAISVTLPEKLEGLVRRANEDDRVHVIVLRGAGAGFCSGYDLKEFAETKGPVLGSQALPWCPMIDYQWMKRATDCYMSLFKSLKPTVAVVHGVGAVAGGSDICLCCDLVVMTENARIGYPPARVWGCPTTAMWVYRLGPERAKRMLLTGDLIDGKTAKAWGLVLDAVPDDQLEETVSALTARMATVPKNQLMMQKLVVNQAIEHMGLHALQVLSTLFDGHARHSPEGIDFKKQCETVGFKKAVQLRDSAGTSFSAKL